MQGIRTEWTDGYVIATITADPGVNVTEVSANGVSFSPVAASLAQRC
jgi:hypothetical protein